MNITTSEVLRRSMVVAALGAAAWLLLATIGCASVQRDERSMRVELKTSEAAAVTVQAAGSPEARALGAGPVVRVEKLTIVRKIFPSGVTDYWLKDATGALPPNLAKPAYAAPEYSAGNDYPLELTFAAAKDGFDPALASLTLGREELEKLFADAQHAPARIEIALDLRPSPAAAPEEPRTLTPSLPIPGPEPEDLPITALPGVVPVSNTVEKGPQ